MDAYKQKLDVNGSTLKARDLASKLGTGIVYVIMQEAGDRQTVHQYRKYDLGELGIRPEAAKRNVKSSVEDFLDQVQIDKSGVVGYVSQIEISDPEKYSIAPVHGLSAGEGKLFVYRQKPATPNFEDRYMGKAPADQVAIHKAIQRRKKG